MCHCPRPSLVERERDNVRSTSTSFLQLSSPQFLCYYQLWLFLPPFSLLHCQRHLCPYYPIPSLYTLLCLDRESPAPFGLWHTGASFTCHFAAFPCSSSILTTVGNNGARRLSSLPQWLQLELEFSTLELGCSATKIRGRNGVLR